jgi:DivIVA domain-containing protein
MMRRVERSRPGIPVEADVRGLERRSKGFPSAGRLGYRRQDVDAFVGRAIAALRAAIARNETLRTGSTPASGRWPDASDEDLDLEGAIFGTARWRHGYDMRSVDELLDEIADHLHRLAAERRALDRRGGGSGTAW